MFSEGLLQASVSISFIALSTTLLLWVAHPTPTTLGNGSEDAQGSLKHLAMEEALLVECQRRHLLFYARQPLAFPTPLRGY